MDKQLDVSTAPGWLKRMWDRRKRQTLAMSWAPGLYVFYNGLLIGFVATQREADEMLAACVRQGNGHNDR